MAEVSTDPATLLTASAEFLKLSDHQLLAVRAYTLASMAGISTDAATLLAAAESAGFTKLSPQQLQSVGGYVAPVATNNALANSSGSGTPEGVVTGTAKGIHRYFDYTNKVDYVFNGTVGQNTGWQELTAVPA